MTKEVDRLRRLSDEALETLAWHDLARYIDTLHAEYEWFSDLIRTRKLGRDVLRPSVEKARRPMDWR